MPIRRAVLLQLFKVQAVRTDVTRGGDKGCPTTKLRKVVLERWTVVQGTTKSVVTEPNRGIECNIEAIRFYRGIKG
jgi:hypothetical protein